MDYRKCAQEIYDLVGKRDNLVSAAHCATRLRLVTNDNSKVNIKKLEDVDGVLTDAFYTMLLGFDGETALGRSGQNKYKISLEDGSPVSEANGELSNSAFSVFYGEE